MIDGRLNTSKSRRDEPEAVDGHAVVITPPQMSPRRIALLLAGLLLLMPARIPAQPWRFVDVTIDAGLGYQHGFTAPRVSVRRMLLAGVAAGDYDNDGWIDLYAIRGDIGPNLLFRNTHDGRFEDVAGAAGVAIDGAIESGALFADFDGDGWLDLFVGGLEDTPNRLFRNAGDGTFVDATAASGLVMNLDTFSATAGDYDRDGDLDLFLAHWDVPMQDSHLWNNDGAGSFVCVDATAGLHDLGDGTRDYSFTGNFTDIDADGWPDLLVASDFGTSRVFMNNGDGTFRDATTGVISDENGMGAAVGDYDNDGDLDWFVSSIWEDSLRAGDAWGITGNRMYRNRGDGSFEDATDEAGVRRGFWGWGSSFADLDNDGHLDLYHVNGYPFEDDFFLNDPALLFVSAGDGTFVERSAELGADLTGQGRGIVCFDFDRDGDLDIFVANHFQAPVLLRNDGGNAQHYLSLVLRGAVPNTRAIGARVRIEIGGTAQLREVSAGNNYLSQNPADVHFGLGESSRVDRLTIDWPDGAATVVENVAADQRLVVEQPVVGAPPPNRRTLRILGSHPNPFASETVIRFDAAGGANATATVYDVSGHRIRRLDTADAGTVRWDGRDGDGARVASGIYLLRVESSRGSDSIRIVLVR
jgi:enediyne biosynthesis protein E4